MRITERGIFALLLFVFAGVILWVTQGMRNDVSLVPRMIGVLLFIFAGLQMLMDFFPAIKKRLAFLDSGAGSMGGEGVVQETEEEGETLLGRYRFFGWIAAYIALIYFTNMIIATSLSLFVYLKWVNKETWLMAIVYSLATALFIYVVFVLGFKLHYFV